MEVRTRQPFVLLFGLIVLLIQPIPVSAKPEDPAHQRKDFLAAEEAWKQNEQPRYHLLKSKLKDYPLYPYLEFQELRSGLGSLSKERVSEFLERYADSPLARRLRIVWLDERAKRGDWRGYIGFYRDTNNSTRRCRYLHALIETGQQDRAWPQVEPIWLSGYSRPDACDPVFDAWRKAGKLTPDLVWQRIDLAMNANRTRLAKYLDRFLPQNDRQWLESWLAVHRQPRKILDPSPFAQAHAYREKILLHGLKRLARKDTDAALSAWKVLADRYRFDDDQVYQAQRSLALAVIRSDHPQAMQQLDRFEPRPQDTRLMETRVRAALSRQEWDYALAWVQALPKELGDMERWRYWRARALEAQGEAEQAGLLYHTLAGERSYHGFLAADRVGREYRLDHNPLVVPADRLGLVAERMGLRRAGELFALGRFKEARSEWRLAVADFDRNDLQAAAKLAQGWGWHEQAIFTLARTRYWDDLELRFPVEHQRRIEQEAARQRLDDAWVYAVVRQESAFASDARSSAGALGLMQLMPGTARDTARQIKLRRPTPSDLLSPETNIRLGTAYLREVLGQLNEHPVLATAAYNAGPHRVKRWLPQRTLPADLWVENIPFRETRHYTERVLTYAVIYDLRLGNEVIGLDQRMPPVQPPATSVAEAPERHNPSL